MRYGKDNCTSPKTLHIKPASLTVFGPHSINQGDIPERGSQVKQMRRIYESAQTVLIWLGPDNESGYAQRSVDAIKTISDFLCNAVQIPIQDLESIQDIYQTVIFKNQQRLPEPDKAPFSSEELWTVLSWFYSRPYFTRVWVIQELSANKSRVLHCGDCVADWNRVELVAGYIVMETAFSKKYGFSDSFCWRVSTAGGELTKYSHKWLFLLYLASNYKATDARDVLYGLKGLMTFKKGSELLDPDYHKTREVVYRDAVEAALVNFEKTDVLLYLTGADRPSWVPRWDAPMLFRNPFRFGNEVPWTPAGDTRASWRLDRDKFVLHLKGLFLGSVKLVEPYNEQYFGNTILSSEEGRNKMNHEWQRLLETIGIVHRQLPFNAKLLTVIAVSLSYGLNEKTEEGDPETLLQNFVSYLKLILKEELYNKYVPPELSQMAESRDGRLFGKPVWDFSYPQSYVFITEDGLIGSCVSSVATGDTLFAPLGCTYPSVLRLEGDYYTIRGFAFAYGVMKGERAHESIHEIELH